MYTKPKKVKKIPNKMLLRGGFERNFTIFVQYIQNQSLNFVKI